MVCAVSYGLPPAPAPGQVSQCLRPQGGGYVHPTAAECSARVVSGSPLRGRLTWPPFLVLMAGVVCSHGAGLGRHPLCVDGSPFWSHLATRGRLGWNLNSPSGAPSLVCALNTAWSVLGGHLTFLGRTPTCPPSLRPGHLFLEGSPRKARVLNGHFSCFHLFRSFSAEPGGLDFSSSLRGVVMQPRHIPGNVKGFV